MICFEENLSLQVIDNHRIGELRRQAQEEPGAFTVWYIKQMADVTPALHIALFVPVCLCQT